jgi:TRAP-type C4-dicarboxylate transport system permease small subunit
LMRIVRRLLAIVCFVALLVGGWHFAARNAAPVIVHHPAGAIGEMQLWVALLVAFASGVGLAGAIGVARGARIRLVARRYRKLVAGLQAEVHQLRSLPLADRAAPSADGPAPPNTLERGS